MHLNSSRREFLIGASAALVATAVTGSELFADEPHLPIRKAVNLAMIETTGSVEDKFALIKSLGFEGVEINAPGDFDRKKIIQARDKTGITIHGVVDSVHWKDCLSDPDPKVRERGAAGFRAALADAQAFGASTVLLVPGRVTKDVTYDDVWKRSHVEIEKLLPAVEQSGVKIGIEVVWNNFIMKPQQMVDYVDSFKSPSVGAYFDIGNVVKWGIPPAVWIRALGKRIVKLHVKGYKIATAKWVDIGEGDEHWSDVRAALREIGYHGWATAEVPGGGEKVLKDIAQRMNRVLNLA